jgi:tetratricopeptide (TPR) repeat protein
MATVYLAEDQKHHRRVAVKVLRPDLAATLGPARFLREIEIAAGLQHPHVLPLLDSGEADGFLYYVMPFIEGESLRDRLTRQGELPVTETVRLLRDVADALSYAHARGVVHRDIKPDNVMIAGRHALVTDFGVAKAVSEATGRQTMTTIGVALGTPAYMAPEQAAADPHVDHRADIYAFGAMAYELLTGRPPFTGLTPQQVLAAHVTEAPQPVTSHRAACPPALAQIIMRCLAKRPADRWQSADEVVEQLEALGTPSGGTTPTQTAPTTAVRVDGGWSSHPLRVAGLFLLVAIAVLGVVYFLTIQLGLPDWVPWVAVALLAAGLPIMTVTGIIERRRAQARATGVYSPSGETPLQGWFTWRRATLGGVFGFAALGVGTIGYTAMRLLGIGPVGTLLAAGTLKSRDRLVIAGFENRTADSTLGPSVTDAFRIDLAQSPVVTILSSSELGDALRRMGRSADERVTATLARELATRENAKAYLVGEVSPIGKGLVLTTRLLSATDGAELVALRETADDDRGILPAIDRLSRRLRERIGESLRTIRAAEPLDQVTTSSLAALRLYSQAVRQADAGNWDQAIPLLEQAVTIDTTFAMAYRKLAVALSHTRSDFAREIEAASRAFHHRERLPEVERYQAEAYYYLTADYNLDKVIAAYRALLAINPDESTALNNIAIALSHHHEYAEAERMALHATEVDTSGTFFINAVHAQLAQNKTAEARATVDRMAKVMPGSPDLSELRGLTYAALGQYDSARAGFLASSQVADLSARANGQLGLFQLGLIGGRLNEAERIRTEAAAAQKQMGDSAADLTLASDLASAEAVFRGRRAEAARSLDAALNRYPLTRLGPLNRPYRPLILALLDAGETQRARQLYQEYLAAVPAQLRNVDPLAGQVPGRVALAEGRSAEAIQAFRAWNASVGCPRCGLYEIGLAFDALNQPDSAIAAYQAATSGPAGVFGIVGDSRTLAPSLKRLGELYEGRDRDKALEYYGRFATLWKSADPDLQPVVREVQARMAKLAGEH